MTELGLKVDLAHPVARVWRAMTDRRLLSAWFLPADGDLAAGQQVHVEPPATMAGFTGGFDIEVVVLDESRLLQQRWRAKEWQALVTWELTETEQGCRLRMAQTGFYGLRGEHRRRELRRTYQELFGQRLPAVLDRLASGAVDLGGTTVDLHTAAHRERLSQAAGVAAGGRPRHRLLGVRLPAERRLRLLSMAGAMVLAVLLGTGAAVFFAGNLDNPMLPTDPAYGLGSGVQPAETPSVQPDDSPSPRPTTSWAPGGPVPSAGPSAGLSGGPSGGPLPEVTTSPVPGAPLAGYYRTISVLGLGGFDTEVTVHNPSTAAQSGWTVVLTMPSDKAVENRSSDQVVMQQVGSVVTLTPTEAAQEVAANGTVTFVIRSSALLALGQQAKGCTINGADCSKL